MDSPAECVANLEADLRAEKAARERAERERDEYQAQVHALSETRGHMTSAASLAAGAAEIAITRLQDMKTVVDGAIEWFAQAEHDPTLNSVEKRFRETVRTHIKRKESQS